MPSPTDPTFWLVIWLTVGAGWIGRDLYGFLRVLKKMQFDGDFFTQAYGMSPWLVAAHFLFSWVAWPVDMIHAYRLRGHYHE